MSEYVVIFIINHRYSKEKFKFDLTAGVTVGIMAIPQVMCSYKTYYHVESILCLTRETSSSVWFILFTDSTNNVWSFRNLWSNHHWPMRYRYITIIPSHS